MMIKNSTLCFTILQIPPGHVSLIGVERSFSMFLNYFVNECIYNVFILQKLDNVQCLEYSFVALLNIARGYDTRILKFQRNSKRVRFDAKRPDNGSWYNID